MEDTLLARQAHSGAGGYMTDSNLHKEQRTRTTPFASSSMRLSNGLHSREGEQGEEDQYSEEGEDQARP
eukprot:3426877-Pyramimonas_sp.AAC.1